MSVIGEYAGISELTSKEEDRLRILVGYILDSSENKVGTSSGKCPLVFPMLLKLYPG